jgi:hypothetical protein
VGWLEQLASRDEHSRLVVRVVYLIEGRPYVDLIDPTSGQIYMRIPVLCQGGGPDVLAYVPLSADPDTDAIGDRRYDDASHVLLHHVDGTRAGFAGEAVFHPSATLGQESENPASQGTSHSGAVSVTDIFWINRTARMILSPHGHWTVVLAGDARVDLAAAGVMRIARAGVADDAAALAGPVEGHLDDLNAHLTSLRSYISTLEGRVDALSAAMADLAPYRIKLTPTGPIPWPVVYVPGVQAAPPSPPSVPAIASATLIIPGDT